ncbi:MAG TPA: hypothetical protein VGO47_15340, partial [Chlamydiales bacterium]|nr:hypothetical protein [Chlamydiales bacterium]
MTMNGIGTECSLDAFLRQDSSRWPPKGALVRVTYHEDSSSPATVKNIVFAEVRCIQGRSLLHPEFSGIPCRRLALIGLNLEKDMLNLKKSGIGFCGNVQVLDKSELQRVQDPAYKSLGTIAVIEKNYFEHIQKVTAEATKALTPFLVGQC